MLQRASETEQKFHPLPAKLADATVNTVRNVLASAAATIAEGLLISTLMNKDLSPDAKKKAIQSQLTKISEQGKIFKKDIEGMLQRRLTAEFSQCLVNS